jgi:hypothetical protein
MSKLNTERSIRHNRFFTREWLIVTILVTMFLTACKRSSSTVFNSLDNNEKTNLPLIKQDTNLNLVVLSPEDVSDLYQGATYSISQSIVTPESKGVNVTYPTQFLPHTTAFADGFSTQIEIFYSIDQAVNSYDTIISQQSGKTLVIKPLGDDSHIFWRTVVTPEGFNLESSEYAILFREQNAVAIIILRTDKQISSTRLGQLATLVIDRLHK